MNHEEQMENGDNFGQIVFFIIGMAKSISTYYYLRIECERVI